MWKHRAIWPCGLALGLALGAAGASQAEEPAPPVAIVSIAAAPVAATPVAVAMASLHWSEAPAAAPAAAPEAKPAADAQPASDAALDTEAGRGTDGNVTVALTEQSLSAVNTGNTINAGTVNSGAISMTDSALSGFSGISNIMMNTGHNNNLQSNMSVTVIITP